MIEFKCKITRLLALVLILVCPLIADAIKDDAMVIYLSFDEGKGKKVADLSGQNNHGEIAGGVKWMKDGKVKSALFFNEQVQKDVVKVEASKSLAITKSLTMEVWLYPQSVGAYRNIRGQAGPHTYYLSVHQSKPSVWLGCAGAGGRVWNSAKTSLPENKWSHVAAVYEFNKELRFYLNGKLDGTHTVKGEIPISNAEHWFGNRLDGPWPYKGMLDEFVIYNRVLTAAEIQQDMKQVLSVSKKGKLAVTWGDVKKVN